MRFIFSISILLNALLLFLIQPMLGKMVLPIFGGSQAVWTTSLLFFQTILLLGYGYAHLSVKWLGARKQALFHLVLLLVSAIFLPIAIPRGFEPNPVSLPALQVFVLLVLACGAPFTIISAGAPTFQAWFATTRDPQAKDPYFLYAASNLGSLLALLAYPTLVEPRFRLKEQAWLWAVGYGTLIALAAICAVLVWRSQGQSAPLETKLQNKDNEFEQAPPTWATRLQWLALSAVPSSLLLGVTTYLSTDLAPIPLIWIVPLTLYLLTFIWAFARRFRIKSTIPCRLLPLLAATMVYVLFIELTKPFALLIAGHLLTFFVAALACHSRLAESRPPAQHLTEFYFWLSLGGAIGGLFNALVAPAIFPLLLEYPLALGLASLLCLLQPKTSRELTKQNFSKLMDGLLPFGASLLSLLLVVINWYVAKSDNNILTLRRSFYGNYRVSSYQNSTGNYHSLTHGSTIHGVQNRDVPFEPLSYYHLGSGVGEVFAHLSGEKAKSNIGLVGLGTGTLAAYGEPGQTMDFYEIDPSIAAIASNPAYFSFLSLSKAKVNIVLGDARLSLKKAPPAHYGIIILDAFSSDSIPIHLLTLEAMQLYLSKLVPEGVLVYHVSNRYLDLYPVVLGSAEKLGMRCIYSPSGDLPAEYDALGKDRSEWILVFPPTWGKDRLDKFKGWTWPSKHERRLVWTDDYSNVLSVFIR